MNEIQSKLPLLRYRCDEEMLRSTISQHLTIFCKRNIRIGGNFTRPII